MDKCPECGGVNLKETFLNETGNMNPGYMVPEDKTSVYHCSDCGKDTEETVRLEPGTKSFLSGEK